jgi:antitoxin ParD1/3/4
MRTIQISLPDELMDFIEEEVKLGAYSDADEYLEDLVAFAKEDKARSSLEALLIEGLESGPAEPMTDQDWESMRARIRERGQARKSA